VTRSAAAASRDDRTLLALHVAGDPSAFEELVRRHRDRLWGVALRTLGDPDDAADAVQDGLISAFRSAATFRGEAAVTTWLHRIVVNACLDLARRRTSRPTVPLGERDPVAAGDQLGERDLALAVVAALRELPTEQATAVVLVHLEGFSVEEAALVLEVPAGTVKSRCSRARARLAATLADPGANRGNPTSTAGVPTLSDRGGALSPSRGAPPPGPPTSESDQT
jgi:RNA polymerase sigma-70 factor (ECF subfamily)